MYRLSIEAEALEQQYEAAAYYFEHHPEAPDHQFNALTDEAFALARLHPRLHPRYGPDRPGDREYRRVIVWKFVYIYTVDDEAQTMRIVYIHHEAADPLPPLASLA